MSKDYSSHILQRRQEIIAANEIIWALVEKQSHGKITFESHCKGLISHPFRTKKAPLLKRFSRFQIIGYITIFVWGVVFVCKVIEVLNSVFSWKLF